MDIWDYIFEKCVSGCEMEFDFEVEAGARRGYAVLPASLLRVIKWESATGLCYADRKLSLQRRWTQGLHGTKTCMDHMIYVRDGEDLEFFLKRLRAHFGQDCGFTLLDLEKACPYDTDALNYRQIRVAKDWRRLSTFDSEYVVPIVPVKCTKRGRKPKAAVTAA